MARRSERPFEKTRRVGSAGLFRPCGVSRLADATSIGGVRFLKGTKNPLRTLSRRHSQTVSDPVSENDPVPPVRIPPPVIATFMMGAAWLPDRAVTPKGEAYLAIRFGAASEACKARIGRWL